MKTLLTNAPTIVKSGLTLLGLAVTTNLVWTGLVGLYRSSMRRQIDLKETYASDIVRSYAVITGGANGIGRQFALALAKQGFNLVLMDLNEVALQELQSEIKLIDATLTVILIVVDFGQMVRPEQYNQLTQQLDGLDICILINNVGVGVGCYGKFQSTPISMMFGAYRINLYPAIFITKRLMQGLQQRAKKSLIVNMASSSAIDPLAYFFLYGATKRFLVIFGESLRLEQLAQKQTNIDIVTFTPAYINTALTGFRQGLFVITPKQFISSALRQIGYEHNTIGHWVHKLYINLPHKVVGRQLSIRLQERQERALAQGVDDRIQAHIKSQQQV